ncbi:GGDEF domain-containing protein [Streptomyces caniscabiei]|uniref:GGDEF domain-containing protein n=1 Tax=Streptomyces caniscabiei TaxID=2746961 RepID=UPI000A392558|nr:GGDEF domain-containing protein [Streptomyces caniscabiei]
MIAEAITVALPTAGWALTAGLLGRKLRAARRDPVSRLWTRLPWMRRADRLIRRRQASHVLMLDLDGFKPVNDSFGHPAGDAVLRAVGARLDQFTAEHGGPHTECARLGGDEFVATITLNEHDVEAFAAGLAHELAQPVPWPDGPLAVTASIGIVAIADLEQPSASTALKRADEAMYAVKKSRGGQGHRAPRRSATTDPGAESSLQPTQGGKPMVAGDGAVVLEGFLDEETLPGTRDDTARFRIHLAADEDRVDEALLPCVVEHPVLAAYVLTERERGDLLRVSGHLRLPQTPDGAMWLDVQAIVVLHPTLLTDPTDEEVTPFVERYASYMTLYDPEGLTHVWHESGEQVGVTDDPSEISDLIHAYERPAASGEIGGPA